MGPRCGILRSSFSVFVVLVVYSIRTILKVHFGFLTYRRVKVEWVAFRDFFLSVRVAHDGSYGTPQQRVRSCEVAVSHAGVILGIVSLPLSIAHVHACAS